MSATPTIPVLPGEPVPSGSPPARAWQPGRNEAMLIAGFAVALLACHGGIADLFTRWYRQEEYSHGYFIPLISLWLLYSRRHALVQSRGSPSAWGLGAIGAGIVLLAVGELAAIMILVQFALLAFVVGLVLCYGGRSLLRVTVLPIAVLLFCIPPPYFIESQLTWRLQLLSSEIGVGMLRVLGYSVYLEGNVIDLGSYKLQVVEACSGLRYLYPLLSVGFIMAYMYPAALHWRALVLASTVPVTVITNSLRIAVTGVLVERWGSAMADGFLHYFEGWIIFLACQVVLMLEIMLIERFTKRRTLFDVQQFPHVAAVTPSGQHRRGAMLGYAVAAMLIAFFAAQTVNRREEAVPQRSSLKLFPTELGGWAARESALPVDVERSLGLHDYVLADYVGQREERVNFYVAYYATQRKGVSPHSPQVCIPGGGWVIAGLDKVRFALADGTPLEAVRVLIDKGGDKALVYYWFDQRGHRLSSEYAMKWQLLRDAVVRNRTDGALVRVITDVARNEDMRLADERLVRFVRAAQPRLAAFVPG